MSERHMPNRSASLSGFAFVVLFVGGVIPLGDLFGSIGDSDATFETYFSSAGNRIGNIVGGVLLGAAGFVFLWFLHQLREYLRSSTSESVTLVDFGFNSGAVFVALLLVGVAALITVPFTITFGGAYSEHDILQGQQAALPQLGYVVVALFGFWAAATAVAAATVSARRSGAFPKWLCRLGFASAGLLVLLGLSGGLAFFVLPVWVLAVSVHWIRSRN